MVDPIALLLRTEARQNREIARITERLGDFEELTARLREEVAVMVRVTIRWFERRAENAPLSEEDQALLSRLRQHSASFDRPR